MTSSGEKTWISVRVAVRGFSTSATGFAGRRCIFRARSMTPWKTVIVFSRVRFAIRRSGSISSPPSARPGRA